MILIDTNIFMYAAGATHPFKDPSADLVERIARGELDASIDAEVLQEILHRYRAQRRWEQAFEVYDLVRTVVPRVIPITAEVLDVARQLLENRGVGTRDALHAAAAFSADIAEICSYDTDFDRIPGLRRMRPDELR